MKEGIFQEGQGTETWAGGPLRAQVCGGQGRGDRGGAGAGAPGGQAPKLFADLSRWLDKPRGECAKSKVKELFAVRQREGASFWGVGCPQTRVGLLLGLLPPNRLGNFAGFCVVCFAFSCLFSPLPATGVIDSIHNTRANRCRKWDQMSYLLKTAFTGIF